MEAQLARISQLARCLHAVDAALLREDGCSPGSVGAEDPADSTALGLDQLTLKRFGCLLTHELQQAFDQAQRLFPFSPN